MFPCRKCLHVEEAAAAAAAKTTPSPTNTTVPTAIKLSRI